VSRRSVLIASMRRNAKQKGAPNILIMPAWVSVNGEPLVTWALDARKPTKEEIAAAVAAWKREQAAKKSDDVISEKPSNVKPAQGSGDEENEQ
jgi:hypothetical protein